MLNSFHQLAKHIKIVKNCISSLRIYNWLCNVYTLKSILLVLVGVETRIILFWLAWHTSTCRGILITNDEIQHQILSAILFSRLRSALLFFSLKCFFFVNSLLPDLGAKTQQILSANVFCGRFVKPRKMFCVAKLSSLLGHLRGPFSFFTLF